MQEDGQNRQTAGVTAVAACDHSSREHTISSSVSVDRMDSCGSVEPTVGDHSLRTVVTDDTNDDPVLIARSPCVSTSGLDLAA